MKIIIICGFTFLLSLSICISQEKTANNANKRKDTLNNNILVTSKHDQIKSLVQYDSSDSYHYINRKGNIVFTNSLSLTWNESMFPKDLLADNGLVNDFFNDSAFMDSNLFADDRFEKIFRQQMSEVERMLKGNDTIKLRFADTVPKNFTQPKVSAQKMSL